MVKEKVNWDALVELLAMKKSLLDERKRNVRSELKAEFEARVSNTLADMEREFAEALKDAVMEGMPVTLIQREVLRTNAWTAWTKWRDLANMPSTRDLARVAKDEAKRKSQGFTYDPGTRTLTVLKCDENLGGYVFGQPFEFVVPDEWRGEGYRKGLMYPQDWYARPENPDTYVPMVKTVDRILKQLIADGEVTNANGDTKKEWF